MQARQLIEALQQTAHMVAVMEQDVLMQAFGDAQVGGSDALGLCERCRGDRQGADQQVSIHCSEQTI